MRHLLEAKAPTKEEVKTPAEEVKTPAEEVKTPAEEAPKDESSSTE